MEGLNDAARQQAAVRAVLIEPIDVTTLEDDGLRRIATHVLDTSRRIVELFSSPGETSLDLIKALLRNSTVGLAMS